MNMERNIEVIIMFKLKRKVEKLLLRILPDKYRIEIYRRGGKNWKALRNI